jgi:hypothetical protein
MNSQSTKKTHSVLELLFNHKICRQPVLDMIPEIVTPRLGFQVSQKESREATQRENTARVEKCGSSEDIERMGLRKVLLCGSREDDSARENRGLKGKHGLSGTSIMHKDKSRNFEIGIPGNYRKRETREAPHEIFNQELEIDVNMKVDSRASQDGSGKGELNFDFLHLHWAKTAVAKNLSSV